MIIQKLGGSNVFIKPFDEARSRGAKHCVSQVYAFVCSEFDALPYVGDRVMHMELFLTETGELIFLEAAARSPGGEITTLIEYTYGIQLEKVNLQLQLSQKTNLDFSFQGKSAYWCWYPVPEGCVESIIQPELTSRTNISVHIEMNKQYTRATDLGQSSMRIQGIGSPDAVLVDIEKLRYFDPIVLSVEPELESNQQTSYSHIQEFSK